MAQPRTPQFPTTQVTPNYLPKEDQVSPEFAKLEAERLWPYVWQLACRLEEIPKGGDYVTYDIVDESIVIVLTSNSAVKAYYNVCPHRGRRLTSDCGNAQHFVCRFHGWQYNLDGENIKVVDKDDWKGCLQEADIRLKEVKVDFWCGFVFINMAPACEPLARFLSPLDDYCSKFEFE